MIRIVNAKEKELASLLREFKQEMEQKRMLGKVLLSTFSLKDMEKGSRKHKEWEATEARYQQYLQRCEQLKSMIDQLQYT